jgi:hypothetical protein
MKVDFTIEGKTGTSRLACELKGAVICGYTGRDQAAIQKHIHELEKEGIKPPPSVPMYYPKPAWGLSVADEMHVLSAQTAGEVEFVLLPQLGKTYVGVGSDHTDRDLEKLDIPKSKQVCPSMISPSLWDLDDVKDHWDQLQFRSWATCGGQRVLYQQSAVTCIFPPDELLARVRARVHGDLTGLAIFSGTPALLTGGFVFAERFEGELNDPVLQRSLRISYAIHTLDWFTV